MLQDCDIYVKEPNTLNYFTDCWEEKRVYQKLSVKISLCVSGGVLEFSNIFPHKKKLSKLEPIFIKQFFCKTNNREK